MKTEMDLAAQQHARWKLPCREAPPDKRVPEEALTRRKMIRIEVDDLVKNALGKDDIVALAERIGRVALVVAGACVQFGCEPDILNFAVGAKNLLEDAQRKLDRALSLSDWVEVRQAAAEMEIIWYGIAANLTLPYYDLMDYLNARFLEGLPADRQHVRVILAKAGIQTRDDEQGGAANDTPGGAPPAEPGGSAA